MRTRSHQLEDISRTRFQQCLPASWVYREKLKDYGLDVEVEVFDEDGTSTGLIFDVQLKSTEKSKDFKPSVRLQKRKVCYYKSLERPVLIVLVNVANDEVYWKWVSQIDFYYSKPTSKTIGVKFDRTEIWALATQAEIRLDLENFRALKSPSLDHPIHIGIEISAEVEKYFPKHQFCFLANKKLKKSGSPVELISEPSEKSAGYISFVEKEVRTSLSKMGGCIAHIDLIDHLESHSLISFVEDVLAVIAISFSAIGQWRLAAEILHEAIQSTLIAKSPELISQAIKILQFQGKQTLALDLLGRAMFQDDPFVLIAAQTAFLYRGSELNSRQLRKFRDLSEKAIESAIVDGDLQYAATLNYNVGSLLRSNDQIRLAARFYSKARKLDSKYMARGYYLRELASLYYFAQHYRAAAATYELALKATGQTVINVLIADSLFFSGQLSASIGRYEEYRQSEGDPALEFEARRIAARHIIDVTGIVDQQRRISEIKLLELPRDLPKRDEEITRILESRLRLDVLDRISWRITGSHFFDKGDYKNAALSFFVEANIAEIDPDAWLLAISSAAKAGNLLNIIDLALHAASVYLGTDLVERFLAIIDKETDDELVEIFISHAHSVLESIRDSRPVDKTIRFVDEDSFIEFDLQKLSGIIQQHQKRQLPGPGVCVQRGS